MYIKDMFSKPIDRDIKGVIKVGQSDEDNIRQELEEYVVTRELQTHFATFFANYKKGIIGHTDKMGVWISGFFGSGKSHFLKILSYLLENKEVGSKRALDYFVDDNKIVDEIILGDMRLAASIPTDVVLFNIDSKSEVIGKQSKEAIVSVFLKVFNEMQGYYGALPYIADLERHLDETGYFDRFKKSFEVKYGKLWIESRNKFDFIQDYIVEALSEIGFMSESSARNWCDKATEPYQMSIDRFAQLIKEYLDKKEKNHHIIFLVDEMGQYIGEDSNLMLNLQTVTEDLGTACKGKVWIIVTSQQEIDKITEVRGNDFSKIQGRFDTRLSLSSANVDEVIKKRILVKNETGEQTLKSLYEQNETSIKNLIVFNDGVEKKLYKNKDDFSLVYPFVPYQFDLLASVLTSIRIHGASGKHLAEGERSMLALFKESAVKLKDKSHGAIVPFNLFYDALHQFLDHSHRGVIIRANANSEINPHDEEDCFNVNVLKALFMIKYIDAVSANAENITSLMVSDISNDRIILKKKVEDALAVLDKQLLIQKNGIYYVFLTDEEQEINREIENQNVETAEVVSKISELLFEDIYSEKKYRHPNFNGRYNFPFNQFVNDRPYKANQNYDIGLRILTPGHDYGSDEAGLKLKSGHSNEVLVALPDNWNFFNELKNSLKIEKYLRLNTTNRIPQYEQIKNAKREEMSLRRNNAKLFLQDALKEASIYVNGDKAQLSSKDISSRINEALGRLVSTVYHKLTYIDAPMDELSIRNLLTSTEQQTIDFGSLKEANANALSDLFSFVHMNSQNHTKTSLRTMKDRFSSAPYGFVDNDIEWLIANLFKKGEISFSINGENISLVNKSVDEIVRFLTKKEYLDKLLTDVRRRPPENHIKAVKDILKELFKHPNNSMNEDVLMATFQDQSKDMIKSIETLESKYEIAPYPGKEELKKGKELLKGAAHITDVLGFYSKVFEHNDDYYEFEEDYEIVNRFFSGEQKNIFEKALMLMSIYDDSKVYIADSGIEGLVQNIKIILKKEKPYSEIPQLPELAKRFEDEYNKILDEKLEPVIKTISSTRETVINELATKTYKDELEDKYEREFAGLLNKARNCNNIATLVSMNLEANTLMTKLLNEMSKKDQEMKEQPGGYGPGEIPKPVKKVRHLNIDAINHNKTWTIKNEEDLEKYISALKKKILDELNEDTEVSIHF